MGYFKKNPVDRRDFLKGSAAGVAALVAGNAAAAGQDPTAKTSAPPPKTSEEAESGNPLAADVLTTDRPGSDFMVDVIKSLGIEYICANPGSTFRGLHESIINY
jgi:acetolactate synthase-1/2/3 large subunit